MSEYLNIITPRGQAVWPAVVTPDSKYGNFKTGLRLSEEEGEALLEKLKEHFVDNYGPKKLAKAFMPIKKDEEGDGYILNAKSSNKPKLADGKGNLIKSGKEPKIGGGSVLKLDVAAKVYDRDGKCGVTLYLNAVQLIELHESTRNAFKAEEGAYVAEDDAEETTTETADEEVSDKDINF